jgi:alpha-galactosidase
VPPWNRVRYDMLRRLGYFVTESSEHFSEYVPWFIKRDRPDLVERYNIPLDEYLGRCEISVRAWAFAQHKGLLATSTPPDEATVQELRQVLEDVPVMPRSLEWTLNDLRNMHDVRRSQEYGSLIIHSAETDQPQVVYANVRNQGLIDNLPPDCCVEVPCLVDGNGVQPIRIGTLPVHLAALMQTNINVQALTVEAALSGRRNAIYHAAMLDPHTGAELELDQIWHLVDDLIEAHGNWLPDYH